MKKGLKIGLIATGVIGAAVAAYVAIRNKNKNRELIDDSPVTGSTMNSSSGCKIFPLKKGSGMSTAPCSVNQVKNLQIMLNALSYAPLLPLKVDGKFGDLTEARLDRLYQTKQVSQEMYNNMKGAKNTPAVIF